MKTTSLALLACLTFGSTALAQTSVVHPDRAVEPAAPTFGARFGRSVAVDGDRLLVGASEASLNGPATGLAHLFERQGDGSWLEVDLFFPLSPASSFVRFGSHVALEGDVAVIASGGSATPEPYVSIFERSAGGVWTRTADLVKPAAGDVGFGAGIAIDGGRIVIAASGSNFLGFGPGTAYVYEKVGGTWTVVGSVAGTVSGIDTGFGKAVALSGDRLALGVSSDSAGGASGAGTVTIAERQTNGTWAVTATVLDPTPEVDGAFGYEVALEGDRLVAGTWSADTAAIDGGETHVFARQANGTWLLEDTLTASDAQDGDAFSSVFALDGDTLCIGAPGAQSANGANGGAAYLFTRRTDGSWFQSTRVELELPTSLDGLGGFASNSIAIDAGHVFLGTETRNDFNGEVSELDIQPLLHGDTTIASTTGGSQTLSIRAGADRAGDAYLMAGSLTGTSPGIALGGGLTVPLVFDAYTQLSATLNAPIVAPVGLLGPDGEAESLYFATQAGAAAFVGVSVHHAAVIIDPFTFDATATNAVSVEIVP